MYEHPVFKKKMARRIAQQLIRTPSERLTRTERKLEQQRRIAPQRQALTEEQTRQIEQAKKKIETMSFEEYQRYYPMLPTYIKGSFIPPEQIASQIEQRVAPERERLKTTIADYDKRIEYAKQLLEREEYPDARRNLIQDIRGMEAERASILKQSSLIERGYSVAEIVGQAQQEEAYKEQVRYEKEHAMKVTITKYEPQLAKLELRYPTQEEFRKMHPEMYSIQPALTTGQRLKEYTKGQKIIGGFVQWVGGEAARQFDKWEQQALKNQKMVEAQSYAYTYRPYTPLTAERTGEVAKVLTVYAPSLIPGGQAVTSGILIGMGLEHAFTKGGVAEAKAFGKQLEESYGIPAKVGQIGLPAVEIGAGSIALKSALSKGQKMAEIKAFKKTPTKIRGIRFETERGGYDIFKAKKDLMKQVGITYKTDIKTPFYKLPEAKMFTLEGGEVYAFRLGKEPKILTAWTKPQIKATSFELSGKGKILSGEAYLNKLTKQGLEPVLFRAKLPKDVQIGAGWVKLKPLSEAEVMKMAYGVQIPSGKISVNLLGFKTTPATTQEAVKTKWLGLGRLDKKTKIITTATSDLEKAFYNIERDQLKLTGKIMFKGKILRLTPKDILKMYKTPYKERFIVTSTSAKFFGKPPSMQGTAQLEQQILKQSGFQAPSYAGKVSEQAMKTLLPKVSAVEKVSPAIAPVQKTIQRAVQRVVAVQKPKVTTKTASALSPALVQKSLLKQQLKQQLKQKQQLKMKQQLKLNLQQKVMQKQLLQQKLIQKQKLMQRQKAMTQTMMIQRPLFAPFTLYAPPIMPFLKGESAKEKKRKLKWIEELTYAPTFTEKALGIEAMKINVKQAKALLKKEFTGFELIKPVKIKV